MNLSGYGPPRAGSTRRNRALAPVVAFVLGFTGCTAAPQAPHSHSATPAAGAHVSRAGTSTAYAAHGNRASAPPASHADVANVPAHGVAAKEPVVARPHARPTPIRPEIYSVNATPGIVHGGDKVRWDIRTSPDIVSVAAHVSAVTLPMYRLSAGHFGLTFSVPSGVPFFFHGVYTCDVRALTASGETLHRDIELTFD